MEHQKSRYDLQKLIDTGLQPFDDLDADQLGALRKAIGKGPLADPLTLTSDGFMIDGHQRAKAMLANGRKWVDASDVRIIPDATTENAMEWAVQLNVARRHLTVEQKADVARKLQRDRRWSQAKIAKLFGVSRPAVSQWFAAYPDPDDSPRYVEGLDGKQYETEPAPPREERPPRNPWRPDGHAFRAVVNARRRLEHEPLGDLDAFYAAKLGAALGDLIAAAEKLAGELPA